MTLNDLPPSAKIDVEETLVSLGRCVEQLLANQCYLVRRINRMRVAMLILTVNVVVQILWIWGVLP